MKKINKQITSRIFSEPERHQIIKEYLNGNYTKQAIWEKYTGHTNEHGGLLRWMRELGYIENKTSKFANINPTRLKIMAKKDLSEKDFETLQLQKRIAELEKQLKDAELKAIAFSTMVDIAEREFKIPIRKKHNTKP
jgi:transposase-like protein